MSTEVSGDVSTMKQALLHKLLARRPGNPHAVVRKVGDGESVAASFAQRRMRFLDELAGKSVSCNLPIVLRLTGDLSAVHVERSLRTVFGRHEALRTRFVRGTDGTMLQDLYAAEDLPFEAVEMKGAGIDEEIRGFASTPFALAGEPLVRTRLLRLGAAEHVLILLVHRIVSDGWSESMLMTEFATCYHAYVSGETVDLPDVAYQYRDYTTWEYEVDASGGFEQCLDFWVEKLSDAPSLLELPHDSLRPGQPSGHGSTLRFDVDPSVGAVLVRGREQGRTVAFVVALAAFAVTLHRLTGESDLVIGVPVANRARPEWEGTYGLFANTVAVRVRLSGAMLLDEVSDAVRREYLAALDHQHVPFDKVANRVGSARGLAFTPLFQVMFNMIQPDVELSLPGVSIEAVDIATRTSNFDLTLHVTADRDGTLTGGLAEYATDVFSDGEINDFIGHYGTVLSLFAGEHGRSVADVALDAHAESELFDEYMHPVPRGVVGEICTGQALRRTGRIARRRADGRLQEVGSRARALILEGIRVYPEVIEAALNALPGVQAAAVVFRGELTGYYVADRTVEEHELFETLQRQRIPRRLVHLDALPHTSDGAVDLNLLSTMDTGGVAAHPEWTGTERKLARLREDVLERRGIGRYDNFYDCGGHSLLAIRLVVRIRDEWDQHLSVERVSEHAVLTEMAAVLDHESDDNTGITDRPAGRCRSGPAE